MIAEPERLMTPGEVIDLLRLGDRKRPDEALRHLRRTGRIGYVRVGRSIRYRPEDLARFIEENSQPAARHQKAGYTSARKGRSSPRKGGDRP